MSSQIIYALLLTATVLLGGMLALRVTKTFVLQFILVFTGGYLFAITIVHLLPEVFTDSDSALTMGLMVLAGFFLQQILEFFTSGVEHGHIHEFNAQHRHHRLFAINIVGALCLHALLEGSILINSDMQTMVAGIVLHKAPAAFALVTVLVCHHFKRSQILFFLFVFALASPLGIVLGNIVDSSWNSFLTALVAGSFLQISTTIVFETSSNHTFNIRKLTYSLLGAILAVISEMYFS